MNTLVTIFFDICQRSIRVMPVMLLALLLTLLFDLLRVPKRISYFVLVFTVLLRMVVPSLPASEFSYFNVAYVRSAIHRESIPDNGGYIGDYEITIIDKNEEKLQATFSDEQKELFSKYTDCVQEFHTISECLLFQNSFRLGAEIMLEVMEE